MYLLKAFFIIVATGQPYSVGTYHESFPTEQACLDFAKTPQNTEYLDNIVKKSEGKLSYTNKCVQKEDNSL